MTNKVYIITSAKFEECYIEEWVQYHLNMGFDKIIINDNNEKDYLYNISDILKEYINNGKVIVERYYDSHELISAIQEKEIYRPYTYLYHKYKNEFDWCVKLDIDEYLEIPETNNDVKKFLYQEKFNNVLSIIVPWKMYKIKPELFLKYERMNSDRDKYVENTDYQYFGYSFKSIIKSTNLCNSIWHHIAFFDDSYNIKYCYPNGIDLTTLSFGENNINANYFDNIMPDQQYIKKLLNICHFTHYADRSVEETVNRIIKLETYKTDKWRKDMYDDLYKQYPDFFDKPRDLYKIYFLDNK